MRLRYTFDGITYLFQVIVPVHLLCTGLVHDPRIICRIGGYVQTGMTDLRPVTVDKRVTHDDKQPPFEICVLVVTFFVKHCLEQGILQQIFRLLPVRCQFVRETEQFVLYASSSFSKLNSFIGCAGSLFRKCLLKAGRLSGQEKPVRPYTIPDMELFNLDSLGSFLFFFLLHFRDFNGQDPVFDFCGNLILLHVFR